MCDYKIQSFPKCGLQSVYLKTVGDVKHLKYLLAFIKFESGRFFIISVNFEGTINV